MKFSASSVLAGIFALCSLAPKTFVSAESILSQVETGIETSLPIDPGMNRLSLLGLDPSVPLTHQEAEFLEATIQDVFNKIHMDMNIDLFAESVSVGTHAIPPNDASVNQTNSTNNLRGGRKLELGFSYNPESDLNFCHYQRGPKRGQWIPGCEFDINLYITECCWMCIDDDAQYGKLPEGAVVYPTPSPTLSFRHFMLFDDDYQDTPEPTSQPTADPTNEPTSKPTSAPTKKEVSIDLEEERGPNEPRFDENPRKPNKKFDRAVLKKLKRGPFSRFHNLKRVRFGHGN